MDKMRTGVPIEQDNKEAQNKWKFNRQAVVYKFKDDKCDPFLTSVAVYLISLAFGTAIVCTVLMHCTDQFDKAILSVLALKDGGLVFNIWKAPEFPFYVYLYFFNYTNAEAFLAGTEKAKLEQLGPYVFEENSSFTDIAFQGMQFLTYTENRTHKFVPEKSNGNLNDTIISPNVVYISAVSILSQEGMVKQLSTGALMATLGTKPFSTISVESLVFGYDDKFSLFARKMQGDAGNPEPFGLLAARNGVGHDRITIGTGVPDVDDVGVVYKYNSLTELNWNDPPCNSLHGSDTTLFPAKDVRAGKVHSFVGTICRKVTLHYESDTITNELPARRFIMPPNVFGNATTNPDNACFCSENCLPSGTFLASHCFQNSPVVISSPHFLNGAPELLEDFEGLHPDPASHSFHMDIHEVGIPLGGHTRVQLNIMVNHAKYMSHLKSLRDGSILPVAWLDLEFGRIVGTARSLLWHATYTVWAMKMLLKWGSPLVALLTGILLCNNYSLRLKKK